MIDPRQAMGKVRLDKWLWAARFFRTRAKAKDAIVGGKVHVAGARGKPSRELKIGEELRIRQGYDEKVVVVTALSDQRRSANEAALLYSETEASLKQREEISDARRAAGAAVRSEERPSKKQRRAIHRFKDDMGRSP
jgi:ribosome-associated heat shock protein Hsp15